MLESPRRLSCAKRRDLPKLASMGVASSKSGTSSAGFGGVLRADYPLLIGLASAGFFCNGEIGPIGKASYLHGYTASVALFCE